MKRRIRIEDLPKNEVVTKEEMNMFFGGSVPIQGYTFVRPEWIGREKRLNEDLWNWVDGKGSIHEVG